MKELELMEDCQIFKKLTPVTSYTFFAVISSTVLQDYVHVSTNNCMSTFNVTSNGTH